MNNEYYKYFDSGTQPSSAYALHYPTIRMSFFFT